MAHSVSFVSVTQQFNTTTSMGSADPQTCFCPLPSSSERSTSERIRDKIAASKRKGLGGSGGNLAPGL